MARIRLRCARQPVIEQAVPQGAVRIVDELRGLQVALRRSIALKRQARRELIHRRQHLTNPTARGGVFSIESTGSCHSGSVKTTWGAIPQKAPPGFTMAFPSIFRVFFGLRLHGRTDDARLEISKADGSDPIRGPGAGMGRCGSSQTPHHPTGLSCPTCPRGKAFEPQGAGTMRSEARQ